MDKEPRTPFPTTGYFGPKYFCDREDELEQLTRNLKGGNSTTLIALRRLGKTSLIKHLFHHIEGEYIPIYLDILPTESLNDLLNQFSTALAAGIPERHPLGKKIWDFIRSLRPMVSFDALQGNPVISVRSTPEESKKSMGDLLAILEMQNKPVIIAIDEFQQILEYPETQTDAWLRSLVQQLRNVHFIFAGSQQHLMQDLFSNPSRPFYRSTQFLRMQKLPHDRYREFIHNTFRNYNRFIELETVEDILKWGDNHTYYVQLICNRIFSSASQKIGTELWKDEADKILKEQEFAFFSYREMLTKPQWNLLRAIAREGIVYQPTSYEFISSHNLGNPATVSRSLKSLQKMELIYRESYKDGAYYYAIYDLLFRRWINR
jgi:AAA+ ATPase superfamily predicted ATPase